MHLLLSGVFERHPGLRFVMTEQGAAWLPPLLERLDRSIIRIRQTGATGELRYGAESILPMTATEYFRRNCWVGVSQPKAPDVEAILQLGLDRFMWGSDFPHDEGTAPFTREHLRQLFHSWPEGRMRQFLAETASRTFDFDLDALQPIADEYGPTVGEVSVPLVELPENPNEALVRGLVG